MRGEGEPVRLTAYQRDSQPEGKIESIKLPFDPASERLFLRNDR